LPADLPVVIVENASLPGMTKTAITLGELRNIAERTAQGGPALIMIGRVFQDAARASGEIANHPTVEQALTAALRA
jgi:siroheme synthase